MARFRKKPVEIEAILYDGPDWVPGGRTVREMPWNDKHFEPVRRFVNDASLCMIQVGTVTHGGPNQWALAIKTLEGNMRISHGDWIIRGVKGEFYPCKPDIFEATYEAVDDDGRDRSER